MLSGDLPSQIRQREEELSNYRDVLLTAIVVSACLTIIGIFWRAGEPSLPLTLLGLSCLILFSLLLSIAKNSHTTWIHEKLAELDIEWHSGSKDELENLLGEIEQYRGKIMEKETVGDSGGQRYRTRGKDEKGPDWGRSDSALSGKMPRRDGLKGSKIYDNLEGPLTENEKLMHQFDIRNATEAQKRWLREEEKDLDIIEAGVDNLGDLLKSGFFEKGVGLDEEGQEEEKK
ncbi:MAG: hypothetical protein CXT69_05325 [Methanobacteriota archaeon]|nr:MAG: hypothetical protein CXT69_05325 [Euryarchaeota archaeon]HIK78780.1 hypothetical protein [Candidatus Poseidoniales archaeon]